jgi:hypothetical protein
MKYAFILGTNAFVVPKGVISYSGNNSSKDFLKINSIYSDKEHDSFLSVDLDITDNTGKKIRLIDNNVEEKSNLWVIKERGGIKILNEDGVSTIIHIQQLDYDSAMSLEHNIVAELEVNLPIAVIRIYGDFKVEGLNISAENEKLFINDNGYGNSVLAGKQLQFSTEGVVI